MLDIEGEQGPGPQNDIYVCVHIRKCMYICLQVYVYSYVCDNVYIDLCVYVNVCGNVNVYVYVKLGNEMCFLLALIKHKSSSPFLVTSSAECAFKSNSQNSTMKFFI